MEFLKLGVIGAGEMAVWSVLPSLHFAPIQLKAICDLDEDRARMAALQFGAPNSYTDYRAMWGTEELDALIIQMHPRTRQNIVLEALDHGYHVFVPKPPAPSLRETEALAAAARSTGRCLMVNFQRRFSFAVQKAREIVAQESFGRINQLLFSFCSGRYDESRGRFYDGHLHAYLLDFAIHHFDLALYLGGEIADLKLFSNASGGGCSLAVALRFSSGAVGTMQLNSHRIWWRNYDRIEVTGNGSYVVLDGLWSIRHYTQGGNSFTENFSDQRSGELTGDAFALREFVEAIRDQREPESSIADAVETMKIYQRVYDRVKARSSGSDG